MISFDATARDFCVVKRQKTSTPLQSLVLMNDPQYVEASRVMAENLVRNQELADQEKIVMAFRMLTGRKPTTTELNLLQELLQKELDHFSSDIKAAKDMLTVGEYPIDQTLDPVRVAAHMVLTSTLMNYDEAVFKR